MIPQYYFNRDGFNLVDNRHLFTIRWLMIYTVAVSILIIAAECILLEHSKFIIDVIHYPFLIVYLSSIATQITINNECIYDHYYKSRKAIGRFFLIDIGIVKLAVGALGLWIGIECCGWFFAFGQMYQDASITFGEFKILLLLSFITLTLSVIMMAWPVDKYLEITSEVI